MNPAVPAVTAAACRGLCIAAGGVTVAVGVPALIATLGITALTSLAFYTLSRPNSSVRVSCGNTQVEYNRRS